MHMFEFFVILNMSLSYVIVNYTITVTESCAIL